MKKNATSHTLPVTFYQVEAPDLDRKYVVSEVFLADSEKKQTSKTTELKPFT